MGKIFSFSTKWDEREKEYEKNGYLGDFHALLEFAKKYEALYILEKIDPTLDDPDSPEGFEKMHRENVKKLKRERKLEEAEELEQMYRLNLDI
jgi:hypothetical protein